MDLSTVDLSTWPPALVWALIVIWIVCRVLPDAISIGTHEADRPAPGSTPLGRSTAPRRQVDSQ